MVSLVKPFLLLVLFVVTGLGLWKWHQQPGPITLPVGALPFRQPPPTIDPVAKNIPFGTEFVSLEPVRTYTSGQTLQAINRFVPGKGITARYPVQEYRLTFNVTVETGRNEPITATIYVPQKAATDNTTFPFIVYGAGSVGLDDRCAPSREDPRNPDVGNYPNQMIAQASQGYIVALPNYEGLDNPDRIHVYFNSELEGRTLLGAADVLLSQKQITLPFRNNTVFFGGYSQGGHAAFAAADRAGTYTPNLRVGGVFGHGPTTDISDFLLMNPNLAPYFVYAYDVYYPEVEPSQMLSPRALRRLSRASTLCVDEAFAYNSTSGAATYTEEFWAALSSENPDQELREKFPVLAKLFEVNDAGITYLEYPTLFLQGTGDPIITAEAQQVFIDKLCSRGVPVSLQTYEGLHHWFTRQESFLDTNAWINALADSESVEVVCNP